LEYRFFAVNRDPNGIGIYHACQPAGDFEPLHGNANRQAMIKTVKLTQRQAHVLWATIKHYVATAEPVGSKALVDGYDFSVSPATIRNTMSMLERVGLLYQPHTSAGRVPSDSGYRTYVDRLLKPSDDFSSRVLSLLISQLDWHGWSLEAVLRRSGQILASLSGYISLITLPQAATARLRHVQLVAVEPGRAMFILVTTAYETQSAIFDLPRCQAVNATGVSEAEETERELQLISNFLNYHLRGRSLAELGDLNWQELGLEFDRHADSLKRLLADFSQRYQKPMSSQILVRGLAEVLRLPEFGELLQVQALIDCLEGHQDQLLPLICGETSLASDRQPFTVLIGAENPLEPMQTCSLVSAFYYRDSLPVGSVSILGPTRMPYEDAIAAVETTASYLTTALAG
jgi:heat-inducible transcriptional repressor